ncbi:unnamed protein product [Calypogeia fissa]
MSSRMNGNTRGDAKGKTKRERKEHAVNGGDREGPFPVKTQKLSEELLLWPYVAGRRSVLGSPPKRSVLGVPPNLPTIAREQDYFMPSIQFGRINVYEGKTTNVDVVVNGKTIKVTLTKESSVAQDWIMQQRGKRFGLDLEWKPNRCKGQPENKVALMQISSETECLLIQMLFLDSIPSALVRFLKDPERKIAGVGIHEDTKKLRRDYGLICSGEVELSALAVSHFQDEGLKRLDDVDGQMKLQVQETLAVWENGRLQ